MAAVGIREAPQMQAGSEPPASNNGRLASGDARPEAVEVTLCGAAKIAVRGSAPMA